MKYLEAIFTLSPCSEDAADLLAALLGEAGFESFETTETGLKAYVQPHLLDRRAMDEALADFPLPGIVISHTIGEAEDRDWNEQWEQEGFEPIIVEERREEKGEMRDERCARTLVIHDGRHLPPLPSPLSPLTSPLSPLISIEIDAHLAFGTGTHQTTRLICRTLLGMALGGKRMLDAGCGTGILAICGVKLGAESCIAYDIDEWSVENTRHNSVINHTEGAVVPLHGDSAVLNGVEGGFDVVTANINRNILLEDLPRLAGRMNPGGRLLMSGFYDADAPLLEQKAAVCGLALAEKATDEGWCLLVFERPATA
jgi:ribosomal protein L11 methyltransferase